MPWPTCRYDVCNISICCSYWKTFSTLTSERTFSSVFAAFFLIHLDSFSIKFGSVGCKLFPGRLKPLPLWIEWIPCCVFVWLNTVSWSFVEFAMLIEVIFDWFISFPFWFTMLFLWLALFLILHSKIPCRVTRLSDWHVVFPLIVIMLPSW